MLRLGTNKKGSNKYTNAMYFDNDTDFFNFCVSPVIVAREYITPAGDTSYFSDFDFTDDYNTAINDNIAFVIRDPKSSIMKHNGVVSYRTISKQTQNLEPFYMEKVFRKKFADK
jgi:hypothetical protein